MTSPNAPTPYPMQSSQSTGHTLLIVDDEPVIRMIARTTLVAAGFAVVEAGDRESAFEAIQKAARPFDLILLDLTLGETKGVELIPQFRQKSPSTPILVISGLGAEEAEGTGANGFLGKPFTKTSLVVAVWQSLANSSLPSSKPAE
jgi:two-component system OmpR family response regulator